MPGIGGSSTAQQITQTASGTGRVLGSRASLVESGSIGLGSKSQYRESGSLDLSKLKIGKGGTLNLTLGGSSELSQTTVKPAADSASSTPILIQTPGSAAGNQLSTLPTAADLGIQEAPSWISTIPKPLIYFSLAALLVWLLMRR